MGRKFHSDLLEILSRKISDWSASSFGFASACLVVIIWLLLGPVMHYSGMWQLFINTATTTITFLMVFLIQRAEQKEAQSLHIKLNKIMERIGISDEMLDVEHRAEKKLDAIEEQNRNRAEQARNKSVLS
jgi:low affinity Fe/Cu permease